MKLYDEVFRTKTRFILLIAILLTAPVIVSATDLRPESIKAWNEYIQATNLQMQQRLAGVVPFTVKSIS
jgi:hypothetical protein